MASILDAAFGPLTDCDPNLWARRAYLMLVGMVYERLAANEDELPTDELVKLAKTLAEQRRADSRPDGSAQSEPGETEARNGRLPARFADVVRQVYGTSFQDTAADEDG